jgi:hypothetical protein
LYPALTLTNGASGGTRILPHRSEMANTCTMGQVLDNQYRLQFLTCCAPVDIVPKIMFFPRSFAISSRLRPTVTKNAHAPYAAFPCDFDARFCLADWTLVELGHAVNRGAS